ncbi:MAG: ribosomal RNA small subunit methyltransferase A [Candidatus Riflebacteria bacterium]|nr:ribosomal RNA small subunit methyltransferase A [Candidatus Riflebacteria bacterium]
MRDKQSSRDFQHKKSLGQNFCINPNLCDSLIELLAPADNATIWEIGPGKGALSEKIIEKTDDYLLFEIDERLKEDLEKIASPDRIIFGDFLKTDFSKLPKPANDFYICGNLPYCSATHIITQILESSLNPRRLVFLLQEEVAVKAAASVNEKEYGYLSVHRAFFAKAQTGKKFSPENFIPKPKVMSKLLALEPLLLTQEEKKERIEVLKKVSVLFTQRRKMVLPRLKKGFPNTDFADRFISMNLSPEARPENISPEQYLLLFKKSGE